MGGDVLLVTRMRLARAFHRPGLCERSMLRWTHCPSDLDRADLLLSSGVFADAGALIESAAEVMSLLSEHGESIVAHLNDSDENPGQRLRDALEAVANL